MILLAITHTIYVATFSWGANSIRPAACGETRTGVSRIILRATCGATVIGFGSLLMGVANSNNYYSFSEVDSVLFLLISLLDSCTINISTSGERCGTILLLGRWIVLMKLSI